MIDHLSYVAQQEGITAEPAALNIIARKADGAMRDALSIFDQVAASSRGNITYRSAIDNLNVLDYNYYNRLLDCFLGGKVLDTWLIYKEIRDRGFDSHFFINGLADYMRDLMVARDPSTIVLLEADDEAREAMARTAAKCSPDFIYRAMNLCNDADLNYRIASNKQFLIELTLAKICQLLSPSPDNRGDGEGRLQKIQAAKGACAQTPQAACAQTNQTNQTNLTAPISPMSPIGQTAPISPMSPIGQTAPISPISPITPTPPITPAAVRPLKKMSTTTFSINHTSNPAARTESAQSVAAAATEKRTTAYSQEQLNAAWQTFINAHPTEHILINTMRASFPALIQNDTYKIMVENEMQRNILTQAMPSLMKHLHDSLSNDNVNLTIEINQGEASPHTWNERQVLSHMIENTPILRSFIDDLKLTIG